MSTNGKPDEAPAFEKVGEVVSIFQRNSNWYANYQHGGRQVRRSLKTKSKKEARRRALLIEKDLLAGAYKHHKQAPLLKDTVETYLNHLRSEGRAGKTIRKYEYCFGLLLELAERRGRTRVLAGGRGARGPVPRRAGRGRRGAQSG
jgi:hypothetical protein